MSPPKIESVIAGAQPLTLLKAARMLGFTGTDRAVAARLRRYVLRRERVTNEAILLRRGAGVREVYLVTMPLLRQHCAELFDTRVETEERLREQFEEIEDKLHRLERQDEALATEILRQRAAAKHKQ